MIHQISKLYSQILLHIRADTTVVHTPRIYVPYGFQFSSKIYVRQMDLSNSVDSIFFAHSTTKKKDHHQELFHYFTLINHHDMSGRNPWMATALHCLCFCVFLSFSTCDHFLCTNSFGEKKKKTCTNPITNGYYEGVSPCNTIVVGVIVSCFAPEWIKLFYDSTKILTIRNEFFNMAHSVYWYKLNWGVCVFP